MRYWLVFRALVARDVLLAYRRRGETFNPLLFFILVVALFPLAVTPEMATLTVVGPGIIWVAALLATLLSLDNLFHSDFDDGALEQLLLSPYPLSMLVSAKILAHWLVTGLPLVIAAPLLALLLHLSTHAIEILLLSLLLGTPVLSLIGAIGAGLTVGLRHGGVLLALIILPLYVPVLIFGAGAVINAMTGAPVQGQLIMLAAFLVLAVTLAPLASAGALRVCVN